MKHVRLDELVATSWTFSPSGSPAACACRARLHVNPYAAPSGRGPARIETCLECGDLLAAPAADASALRIAIRNDLI
ncbi:MAG: hypothetical protein P4L76_17370 [Beijerinckiaceae bacterium]|nr:hypothetical protein [Beijerinckiaceae bacterium]